MSKMNVTTVVAKDYERNDIFAVPENKAKTNPIKPNFKGKKICVLCGQLSAKKILAITYSQSPSHYNICKVKVALE